MIIYKVLLYYIFAGQLKFVWFYFWDTFSFTVVDTTRTLRHYELSSRYQL